jgi:hypothetical protein
MNKNRLLTYLLFFCALNSCKVGTNGHTELLAKGNDDSTRADTSVYPLNVPFIPRSNSRVMEDSVAYKGMVIHPKGIPLFSDTVDLNVSKIAHLPYREPVDVVANFVHIK